jgi:hypothetical protein
MSKLQMYAMAHTSNESGGSSMNRSAGPKSIEVVRDSLVRLRRKCDGKNYDDKDNHLAAREIEAQLLCPTRKLWRGGCPCDRR